MGRALRNTGSAGPFLVNFRTPHAGEGAGKAPGRERLTPFCGQKTRVRSGPRTGFSGSKAWKKRACTQHADVERRRRA